MKRHKWKRDEKVYDGIYDCICSICGVKTIIYILDTDEPTDDELQKEGIPLDCDEGFVFVVMES